MVCFAHLFNDVRVVGDVGVGRPMEAAVAAAVVGMVALGRYYPVVPAELLEADVEALFAALVARVLGAVQGAPTDTASAAGVGAHHEEGPVGVHLLVQLGVEKVDVPVAAAAAVHEQLERGTGLGEPLLDRLGEVELLPPRRFVVEG